MINMKLILFGFIAGTVSGILLKMLLRYCLMQANR